MELFDDDASARIDEAIEGNYVFQRVLKQERDIVYNMLKIIMADTGVYDISFSLKDDIANIKDYRLKITVPESETDKYTISLVFPE